MTMKRKIPMMLTLLAAVLLLFAGCAPKDAGLAVLTGLTKEELPQGELPCRSYYEGDILMLPLCAVAEALGYQAEWDAQTRTAVIDDGYIQKATVTAGSMAVPFEGHLKIIKMDREAELPAAPAVQEGVLYVPAAFFTEFMNDVEYGEGVVTVAPAMAYLDYVKGIFD